MDDRAQQGKSLIRVNPFGVIPIRYAIGGPLKLSQNATALQVLTLNGVKEFQGSREADLMQGDSNTQVFDGSDGADELWGRSGDDFLSGGIGDDILQARYGG